MKYTDRPLDPVLVDIGKRDQDFVLYYGDRPLQTASGREYSHESERLLRNILLEIIETGAVKLEEISVTLFFEIQKDLVEKGRDHVQKNLDALISVDPFIAMKASGKGMMHALPKDGGDGNPPVYGDNLMAGFWRVSSLMGPLNEEIGRMIGRMEVTEPVDQPVPYLVRAAYAERTHAEKAVLQVLCYSHRAGIVLPLMWMLGVINASEYARGLELVRTAGLLDGICEHADLARVPFVSKGSGTLPAAEGKMNGVLLDLSRASDYLALMKGASPAGRDIRSLIAAGESATLEFKSTLRWDLRAGKTSPAIERASLKTISAFLNTNGGILLIGVRDDGTVEGIESDRRISK